jgi:hypothetical protein
VRPLRVRATITDEDMRIYCHCSARSGIIETELRRDINQDFDDHFEILIDSNFEP